MRSLLLLFVTLLVASPSYAQQRGCATMEHLQTEILDNPTRALELERIEKFTRTYNQDETKALNGGILTIPVIVHVVWNTNTQNISDAQIQSQIDVMNDDFRRMNQDQNNTPSVFGGVAADTDIEFCLIETIRVKTKVKRGFGTNDAVKNPGRGGSSVVTPESALNVWVCNIGGGILGYAQFPGGSPSTDGVVCDYRYFGTTGTATAPFDLGRTMTHEVGHYLNLRHIWGDTGCNGDDFVSDTPLAGSPNYTGSPCNFPGANTCNTGSGDLPDMFQNYMDYSDDACMNLFTSGQSSRMWAAIDAARPGLLTASCNGTVDPGPEICGNGIDDDGDGQVDCADGDCATDASCDTGGGGGDGCDTPTGLDARSRRGGREAILSWNAVSGAINYSVTVSNGASTTVSGTSVTITGLTRGNSYSWSVTANCASGSSDPANASFTARLTDRFANNAVSAYPNPARSGEVVVNWNLGSDAAPGIYETRGTTSTTLRVLSVSGQVITTQRLDGDSEQSVLNVSDLTPGVYLIQIVTADGMKGNTKLVKL